MRPLVGMIERMLAARSDREDAQATLLVTAVVVANPEKSMGQAIQRDVVAAASRGTIRTRGLVPVCHIAQSK